MTTGAQAPTKGHTQAGVLAAGAAYTWWGLLPLYLLAVGFADPREVLAQRIVWCVPAAALVIPILSGWRRGRAELAEALSPARFGALTLSALFIFINWGIYVWAIANGRILEAALAYFLTPIVQVTLGVIFFKERLTGAQKIALGLAIVGVIAQGIAIGVLPWVSLALCATWSCYGLVRKQVSVSSASGLFLESAILAPLALGLLYWVSREHPLAISDGPGHAALLIMAGPFTAIPLLLFAVGARRLQLSTLGLLQYIAPSIQFLLGAALGEPLSTLRLVSFAIIWSGLALFSWDAWRRQNTPHKQA